eukprot:GILK01016848.1.p1 GENE.GILK01016848.1~~GILK01016848.1.p1  ORF type:complete len:160 (-),score=12.44 GILK01016848.1:22-501(-)
MTTIANFTVQTRSEIIDLLYGIPIYALGIDFMSFLIDFIRGSSEKNVLTAGLLSYLVTEASRNGDVTELLLLRMNDPAVKEANFCILVFSPFGLLVAFGLRSQSMAVLRAYLRLAQVSDEARFRRVRTPIFDRLVDFGLEGATMFLNFSTCSFTLFVLR